MNIFSDIYEEMKIDNTEETGIMINGSTLDFSIFKDDDINTVSWSKILKGESVFSIRKHTRYIHYPEHSHDYVELNYVLTGYSRQIVGGEDILLGKGDLLFMGPGMKHELFPCSKDDIIINFIIKKEFFNYIFDFLNIKNSLSEFLIDAVFKNISPKALIFNTNEDDGIQKLINDIMKEVKIKSEYRESKLKFMIGLLILELLKLNPLEISKTSYERDVLSKVVKYIEKNYRTATLNEISSQLNLKNYNLAKLIKKECDLTFKEMVKEIRLKKISSLLLYSNLPINELAEEVGFSNTSYFYKLFRNKYGISPKEYKDRSKIQ